MNNLFKRLFKLNIKRINIIRHAGTNANILENCKEVINNNPRNLELMTIARKPRGYSLDVDEKKMMFWNRIRIKQTRNYAKAELYHFEEGVVISVSSLDWCVRKFLYRPNHISAFKNIGKIFGRRCLESGITFVDHCIPYRGSAKLAAFVRGVRKSGLYLGEPHQYVNARPWDRRANLKPWTVPG